MVAVETELVPDVAALACKLRDRPGLFVLRSDAAQSLRSEDADASFVGCDPVETVAEFVPRSSVSADLRSWAGRAAAPRWVGFLPYESARAIERRPQVDSRAAPIIRAPRWQRYAAVARIDHRLGKVVVEGDDRDACSALHSRLRAPAVPAPDFRIGALEWNDADAAHAAKVRRILEYIRAGDVYQVNLARRATFAFAGSPLALWSAMFEAAPSPYGFFLDVGGVSVLGTSPELALDVRDRRLRTAPIKGTRARGIDWEGDAARVGDLDHDPKERAELTMAIDLHRNDLGKVAVPGSVRVLGAPRVVFGRTVMSRVAEVVALLEAGYAPRDAIAGTFPCGSVTGAPKIRAMDIIAELETARRGLYTGLVGTIRRDDSVTLAMAIRTAVTSGSSGEYFSGGGIVLASDPEREAEETRWKAEHLRRLATRDRSALPNG